MSYRTFAGRAEAVASSLMAAGIGPGEHVALLSAGRYHDEAVALAGALLCGAVAVPLDATSPALRLASIVKDRGCRALVHDVPGIKLATQIDAGVARIELDEDGFVLASIGDAGATDVPPDESLGCILHTSGSTGKPKPVPITIEGLDAFCEWMIGLTDVKEGERVLRVAELIFDLAWFDHLATLRAGATLCTMSRRQLAAGKSLAAELERLRPTVIYGVPAMFMKLVAALGDAPLHDALRVICFAGEVFPPRELKALAEHAPGARLFNLFGPTETNVCTHHEVRRDELDTARELPIGVACPYAECRLVDEGGAVVEGVGVGELVVRGPTAMGGEFATRDRVERRGDGLFMFRGRIDRMVKIRGFRVEPGEVEAALTLHEAVRAAAVVVVEHPRLGKTLKGFVTLRQGADADSRALRKHLSERLAPFMVPDTLAILDELPRTTTGKIDYTALRAS
jgi:acyl-coenzyme A synthetase/AMP-(fatty) acid ligase